METRASPFIVGLFTLIVLAGVTAVVFWLGRYGEATGREQYRVVFSDDVTGLTRGSSVLFNGIRVGEVINLSIPPDDPTKVVVRVAVDAGVPVREDTGAQLQFQGITGIGFVQLKAGSADARPIRETWAESEPPIIYAERSTFQDLMEGAQTLMTRLDTVIDRVDTLVASNEDAVTTTIRNFETFTGALAENSASVAGFIADAGAAARSFSAVGERVESLAENVDRLVTAVDPEAVSRVVANVDSFSQNLQGTSERLDGMIGRVDTLIAENEGAVASSIRNFETFTTALADNSDSIERFMADAGAAALRLNDVGERMEILVDNVNTVVAAVEPDSVRAIMTDMRSFTGALGSNADRISSFVDSAGGAAESLNSLAGRLETVADDVSRLVAAVDPAVVSQSVANLETFTSSLAGKSGEFEQFIDDAGAVASQLRQTSQRLDALLVKVDGMVGGEGTGSFMADISAAVRSFRELTEGLDTRLGAITADIQRLGGGGLREFQSFMSEGRRTLNNLDRVIGNLERNPSGFLFGGTSTPEYNPDRRF